MNEFVQGAGKGKKGLGDAVDSLSGFQRFPGWMWRNTDVLDFVGWLRDYNADHPGKVAGFYGLDLYSLHKSMESVLDYLRKKDMSAYRAARERYSCFDSFGMDSQHYGLCTGLGIAPSCEKEVQDALADLTVPPFLIMPLHSDRLEHCCVVRNSFAMYWSVYLHGEPRVHTYVPYLTACYFPSSQ